MQLFDGLIIGLAELTYHRQAGWCSLEDYPFFMQQHLFATFFCALQEKHFHRATQKFYNFR